MSYYDDDFYNEPSEFERQIYEFKQGLIDAVKKEYVDEMDRLRKENAELQNIKENKTEFEHQQRQLLRKLETEKVQFEKSLKHKRLTELFGENLFTAWCPEGESIKPPKCNQCDENRKIKFTSPSGRPCSESCPTCGDSKYIYNPQEVNCFRFVQGERNWTEELPVFLYFERSSPIDKDDNFESNRKIYRGEPYEDITSYRIAFFDQTECQKYCDWINEKPKR